MPKQSPVAQKSINLGNQFVHGPKAMREGTNVPIDGRHQRLPCRQRSAVKRAALIDMDFLKVKISALEIANLFGGLC